MSLQDVRVVIFDLGGTTVQLTVDVGSVFLRAFHKHGVAISPEAVIDWRGASKREAVVRLLEGSKATNVRAQDVYRSFQTTLLDEFRRSEVVPIPGTEDVIDGLRSAGMRVALATGFDAVVTDYLIQRLGWRHRVDAVVNGDDVEAGRPAPDLIFRAMEQLRVANADRVVVVGDTANDIEAGRRANVTATIGVLTGAHDRHRLEGANPTAILESVVSLPTWLDVDARQARDAGR